MEKNVSKFNEEFIKNYDKDSDKQNILEVGVEYPKNLYNLLSNLPFLPERMKIKNALSLHAICMTKKNMFFI